MRKVFAEKIKRLFQANPDLVFLTGDLGYNALEEIQANFPDRFINAGVAEQNMLGVAAGLSYTGHPAFVYSIAPFAVYRTLEQIRLDVCLHNQPVYVVGNGGGYGYGIMGATHHAIEDLACLSSLPNMVCWVPAFAEDVDYCLDQIIERRSPAYLRLGLGDKYPRPVNISMINHVIQAQSNPLLTIITQGPIIKNALQAIEGYENIDIFSVLTLPIIEMDNALKQSVAASKNVLVIEEHVERGGLAEHILMKFHQAYLPLNRFESLHAKGYPSKTYGSQGFHWKESGLDKENILSLIHTFNR